MSFANWPAVRRRKMRPCCWDGQTWKLFRRRRYALRLERVRWQRRRARSTWCRWASCQATRRQPSPCRSLFTSQNSSAVAAAKKTLRNAIYISRLTGSYSESSNTSGTGTLLEQKCLRIDALPADIHMLKLNYSDSTHFFSLKLKNENYLFF